MPSAVIATVEWLTDQLPDVRVLTKTTADLEANPRQIRVVGAGGSQKMTLGAERIILETFEATELAAIQLAFQANDLLAFYMRGVIGDAVVTTVKVDAVPSTSPYTNTNVSQQISRYTVFLHSL